MNPKKYNEAFKTVSEELNVPKNLVETLTRSYYKNVKMLLSDLHHPRINVSGLGIFTAKPSVVKKAIPRFQKYLKDHDTSTFAAYYNKRMLEEKISQLKNLTIEIEKEKKRKEEFLNKRNNAESKENLGE
tara:strand:+ start:1010 stop:1399 length:390 start_codon:yes stop_codon:yes gene_type:complete